MLLLFKQKAIDDRHFSFKIMFFLNVFLSSGKISYTAGELTGWLFSHWSLFDLRLLTSCALLYTLKPVVLQLGACQNHWWGLLTVQIAGFISNRFLSLCWTITAVWEAPLFTFAVNATTMLGFLKIFVRKKYWMNTDIRKLGPVLQCDTFVGFKSQND